MFSPSSRPVPESGVAQERLRTALRMTPIWVFEQDTRLHYTWLQNAETQGNAGGATDYDLMERSDEAERVVAIKARVLATGQPETVEVTAHVAGVARQHRLHLEPIRDEHGRVRGLRGAILDIGQARPEDPQVGTELLRLVGHELRNAVNPVRMLIQLERRRAQGSGSAPSGLATAHAGVERLTRLLEDMLDYARGTTEPLELDLAPTSVQTVLERTHQRFSILHPEALPRLSRADVSQPLFVHGDQARLIQCLLALMERATRTTERDQGIALKVREVGSEVHLEVVDEGSGLPPQGLEHQDDPAAWARACLADHRDEPPFVIALVRTLSHAMGAEFSLSPGPEGRGTSAVLRLVRCEPQREGPPSSGPAPARALKILVVDDSPGATRTLHLLLEVDGHSICEAQTGASCLEQARKASFDVVLLDLGLPDMSGHDVARQIRAQISPCPVLIALTGRSSEADRRSTAAAGFDQHLVKPVDLAGLRRALAAL